MPAALQWLGVALVVAGIVDRSRASHAAPDSVRVAAGAGLAVVAALGFGLFFVGIDAGSDESAAWAVDGGARPRRCPVAVVAALVTSTTLKPAPLLPMLVGVGVFDTLGQRPRRDGDDVRQPSASSPC